MQRESDNETDVETDNFIDCSGENVMLYVNRATKVKAKVSINITEDCPLLSVITLDALSVITLCGF
eukprot:COSAG01_NODE_14521_length_1444_cov_1.031970_1_plen_66_part_00